MQFLVDKLRHQCNRSSTRANYYSIWKKFNQFFIRLDSKPETWEEHLTLFVGFLIDNKKKSTTINSYISAIKSVLKEDGADINEDRILLNSLTKACRYKNDTVLTRLPIRKNLLHLMLDTIEYVHRSQQPFLITLYKAIFITAYYGMFRVGELTKSIHVVKARDVHIGKNKNKIMFILRTSKTHWTDVKPQIIKINGEEFDPTGKRCENPILDNNYCPFSLLKEYINMRKYRANDEEQFFVFRDRTAVTPYHFRSMLKQVLKVLNLDINVYGTHGFRSGRSSDLMAMGISVETIRILGRWRSSAVYTYLRQ